MAKTTNIKTPDPFTLLLLVLAAPVVLAAAEPPVELAAKSVAERMADIAPRFDAPSEDAAYVMPVGTGDLSAMVRYGTAWELHLSKTDFLAPDKILSPGHVQLSFGIPPQAITRFEQRLDLCRGSVVLRLETATGTVAAEIFGTMGGNTLVVAVDDTRPEPQATAQFSVWRPEMTATSAEGRLLASQVHDFDESGNRVADPSKVNPADRFYHLGAGVAAAFADDGGILSAIGETGGDATNHTATLRTKPGRKYWLAIACATTYDGQPELAARRLLDAAASADKAGLLDAHLAWWREFWAPSYIDLRGKDADYLMRLWYVNLYSYASVAEGAVLPKFNGGPGLIHEDDRHWGWGYWWQNTRELLWPMYAANHLHFVRDQLDFYDRTFLNYKDQTASNGKVGIRIWEGSTPFRPGSVSAAKTVSAFDAKKLAAAMADTAMENVKSGYNARSMAQGAELVQLMFDYVAYTGDQRYLNDVVSPWLKETTLFYLSYLKLGDDGFYHSTPSDALEMWWNVKDPMTDMCAIRYCFWKTLNHGPEFGYEPEFLETVRDRLAKLAPLPTGVWKRRRATKDEVPSGKPNYIQDLVGDIERTDACYAPAADVLDDRLVYNMEHPELYVIYPFALVDAASPAPELDRAMNAFHSRRCPNWAGWSQCGIQSARLRLPDTVDVILDHAKRHQRFPYGGWINVAAPLKGSELKVSDVPYFDTAGVNMMALQESLMQSHRPTTAEKVDPLCGGPIVLLPAVRQDWAGRFRLRASGGFLVTVEFQPNRRIERVLVESERGNTLTLANPFATCRVLQGGQEVLSTSDAVVQVPTQKNGVLELVGK